MNSYPTDSLVSVIMPTRNRAAFLHKSINSVLKQSKTQLELIIVDDASTDSTQEVIAHYSSIDKRVRSVRSELQLGGSGARNLGIINCRGRWVAFIDDDDIWLPEKLALQIQMLTIYPKSVAVSCNFQQMFTSGKKKIIRLPDRPSIQDLLCSNVLGGASMCMCTSEILKQIGGFDTELLSGQDWDLWTRLRKKGEILVCPEILVTYMAHEGSRISNNMYAQYQGARRYYFKHRESMTQPIRRTQIAYASFIMSRQSTRSLWKRFRHLIIAMNYTNSAQKKFSYVYSSLPRMVFDWIFNKKNK